MEKPKVNALIAALERKDIMTPEEKAALVSLQWTRRAFSKGDVLVPEGTVPTESCVLIEGLAGRTMLNKEGQSQIVALHVRGDFVDLHSLALQVMDHSVTALTDCEAIFAAHDDIRCAMAEWPHLARLFFTLVATDAAVQRNWTLNLGRKLAEQRLAHLLCELVVRLEASGSSRDDGFGLPITQAVLADILGLSIVHTNRIVSNLRRSGLIDWREGSIRLLDRERLEAIADFHPNYLNLIRTPR